MREFRLLPIGIVFYAFLTAGCGGQTGTHGSWDMAQDFSTVSNPAGPWEYGEQVSGAFILAGTLGYNFGPAWDGVISVNKSGTTVDGIAPNAIDLDSDNATPDARWIAPYSGTFNITIEVGGTESANGTGNENATTAQVLVNGVAAPVSSTTNNVVTYTLTAVSLSVGQAVDVVVPQKLGGGNTQLVFQVATS